MPHGARVIATLSLTLAACAAPRAIPPTPAWDYVVDAPGEGDTVVRVEARFTWTGTPDLEIDERAAPLVRAIDVEEGGAWRSVAPSSEGKWTVPACARGCAVRYAVDVGALARACDDGVDCALADGAAILSPALAWILHPSPKGDVPVTLRVRAADPARFATGLRAAPGAPPGTFAFRSPEIDEGSFTAFGPSRRARVVVGGAAIDVTFLGPPLAMGDESARAWIEGAARCNATLLGRFAVDHTALFVVPMTESDDVLFGKVLALAGPSVALLVGKGMRAESTHRDWVLVHELFHLGFPSFRGEGRWLGEGLATYYEPILRARCGWISADEAWAWLADHLPRGATHAGEGLEARDDLDAIYWGGALFALASDVAIRERTGGARSLDTWVRAVHAAGGDATQVWTVDGAMRAGDRATGTDVLTTTRDRVATRGEPIDLAALLASLGVDAASGSVRLRDDAPLAPVRRAITARPK